MSDEISYAELAARNAIAAVDRVELTRDELINRIVHLEGLVSNLGLKTLDLEQKYNILLAKNFNGGSTENVN